MRISHLCTLGVVTCGVLAFAAGARAQGASPKQSKEPGGIPRAVPDPSLTHSAPEVVLEGTTVEGGKLLDAEQGVAKLRLPLYLCYTQWVRLERQTGAAEIAISLDATGRAADVTVSGAPKEGLRARVLSCFQSSLQKASFNRPSSANVVVRFRARCSVEDTHHPAPPEPKYSGPSHADVGSLETSGGNLRDGLRVTLHWAPALQPCAALAQGQAVDKPSTLPVLGDVDVRFVVGADGTPASISVRPGMLTQQFHLPPLPDAMLMCVEARAKELRFAPPEGGDTSVRTSVVFRKGAKPGAAATQSTPPRTPPRPPK